jgi:hypothetical protein
MQYNVRAALEYDLALKGIRNLRLIQAENRFT